VFERLRAVSPHSWIGCGSGCKKRAGCGAGGKRKWPQFGKKRVLLRAGLRARGVAGKQREREKLHWI
jgi:hypothetical protein